MSIDEMIKVLQAFKDGKQIERQTPIGWIVITNLDYTNFDFNRSIYRIKPQPEYVPFAWNDRDLFRGKWVRWKFENKEFTIDCICERGLCFSGELFTWERLFTDLEFIDGTAFGKLKP